MKLGKLIPDSGADSSQVRYHMTPLNICGETDPLATFFFVEPNVKSHLLAARRVPELRERNARVNIKIIFFKIPHFFVVKF
jgi:hypothetical protein